jgi:ADP-heptose:LPS heptosyltransferase
VNKKKILIIRFSSIGDIVLTSPVIRCLKKQLPGAEIHYVTKEQFKHTLLHNPYIDRLYTFKKDVSELYESLKAEQYDAVVDLHRNLRSLRLKQHLSVKSYAFNKLNLRKFVAVNLKMLSALPDKHIVERYFETVAPLGVHNDGEGLDYFISEEDKVDVDSLFGQPNAKYVALVVGGSYFTKRIPPEKLEAICTRVSMPVICLGDKSDHAIAEALVKKFPQVINACGRYTINQSAYLVKMSHLVITSDTGLMHIAAAFKKRIISFWGNTIPEFGMGPYQAPAGSLFMEVKSLSCRPCSKLGYKNCPKGHFRCMLDIDLTRLDLS